MLLLDVAAASAEVGAQSSRLAKIARIARLLDAAASGGDAHQVAVVVSWLSGELVQRQIGVGWAALRTLPAPADEPTLTVLAVDAAFTAIGAVVGAGSQKAAGSRLSVSCSRAATTVEQTFLRRLLQGELRQGALAGVMADAVARAAAPVPRRPAARRDARRRPARRRRRSLDRWRRRSRRIHAAGGAPGRPDACADRHRRG